MENEADIPRKCQRHEGGVERHGRDMKGHEGDIKLKASSEMTVQGHEGAMRGHRGNSG